MLRVPVVCRGHKLALEYNDVSPNENNHVASAWALLRQPGMDFIYRMSRKNQVQPMPVKCTLQEHHRHVQPVDMAGGCADPVWHAGLVRSLMWYASGVLMQLEGGKFPPTSSLRHAESGTVCRQGCGPS